MPAGNYLERQRSVASSHTDETRLFLEDGDEVILKGCCAREGFTSIGLGTCAGVVLG